MKSLLFVVLLFFCYAPQHVAAKTHIVVDVDGSLGDYAALTTIAQSSNLRGQLRLITISGVTWGHAATVARNMCRFLFLAQLENVTVSLGALQARTDGYDAALSLGGCGRSQGFPATPQDALRRGMKYSRADVTSAFGAAYDLPLMSCDVRLNASEALHAVLNDVSVNDTVTYLAFASSTNLAATLSYIGRQDPSALDRFRRATTVHLLEKGYSLAVDDVSTAQVLSESGLRFVFYMPSFYDPAVTFSFSLWSQFSAAAKEEGHTSAAVAWLFRAWEAKKALVESRSDDPLTAFFRKYGPAGSLVTLCALDAGVRGTCVKYFAALSRAALLWEPPAELKTGTVTYNISGGNVTWPSYLLATLGDRRSATQFVAAQSADSFPPATSASLASVFWSVWLDLLRSK